MQFRPTLAVQLTTRAMASQGEQHLEPHAFLLGYYRLTRSLVSDQTPDVKLEGLGSDLLLGDGNHLNCFLCLLCSSALVSFAPAPLINVK